MSTRPPTLNSPKYDTSAPILNHRAANRSVKSIAAQWLYRAMRLSIGMIFIGSGMAKLMAPEHLAVIIQAYGLIPQALNQPTAVSLAAFEVLAGAGLMFDLRYMLALITALLLLFMLVMAYGVWLGLDVDCGCFGPGDPEGRAFHGLRPSLYRDLVLLTGAGYLYFWRLRQAWRPASLRRLYQNIVQRR